MKEKKICLLVDDDLDDREIFVDTLKGIDTHLICITAENGMEAIKILETAQQLPDFIFLDLNMPIMSGMQFLEQIKKNSLFSTIQVIIYTTSSFENDIKEAQRLGAAHFFVKPYSIVALKEAVSQLLSNEVTSFLVKTS